MKNRPLHDRLGFAGAGLIAGWRRERSFRTHTACAAVVLAMLIMLGRPPLWWALIALAVALVMALELINAALKGVIDRLHPAIHSEIKSIKDMVAGAVVIASVAALAVAAALIVDRWPLILRSVT